MMRVQSARLVRLVLDLGTLVRVGCDRAPVSETWEALIDRATAEISGIGAFTIRMRLSERPWGIGTEGARTLLTALVSDAVKHHDRNSGIIDIACRGVMERLTIAVADDGPGPRAADWDQARSPMVTLRSWDELDGSLGLAIADRICAR